MSVTLKHSYIIEGQALDSHAFIQSAVTSLVPAPVPDDLSISVGPGFSILVSFSVEHTSASAAAAAALKTMQGAPI